MEPQPDNTQLSFEIWCYRRNSVAASDAVIDKTKVRCQIRFTPNGFMYIRSADINGPNKGQVL
jgi:hypothetical protein